MPAIGRDCGGKFIARRVGDIDRLAALARDAIQLEVALSIHDHGRVNEARAIRKRRQTVQLDDILRAIARKRNLNRDGRSGWRHGPDLRSSAALSGEKKLLPPGIPGDINPRDSQAMRRLDTAHLVAGEVDFMENRAEVWRAQRADQFAAIRRPGQGSGDWKRSADLPLAAGRQVDDNQIAGDVGDTQTGRGAVNEGYRAAVRRPGRMRMISRGRRYLFRFSALGADLPDTAEQGEGEALSIGRPGGVGRAPGDGLRIGGGRGPVAVERRHGQPEGYGGGQVCPAFSIWCSITPAAPPFYPCRGFAKQNPAPTQKTPTNFPTP